MASVSSQIPAFQIHPQFTLRYMHALTIRFQHTEACLEICLVAFQVDPNPPRHMFSIHPDISSFANGLEIDRHILKEVYIHSIRIIWPQAQFPNTRTETDEHTSDRVSNTSPGSAKWPMYHPKIHPPALQINVHAFTLHFQTQQHFSIYVWPHFKFTQTHYNIWFLKSTRVCV